MKPDKNIKHMASTVEDETDPALLADPEYREALNWIGNRARIGDKDGLRNIRALLEKWGNPEKQLRCFHIAGTNGKGSVATYLASVLEEAGYKTGLFTSPYIETFRERFQINRERIGKEKLTALLMKAKRIVTEVEKEGIIPTHFEILTAICFRYFADENIDFAVIEVGVGGTYDSTNVIEDPVASLITTIDYDHTQYLGNTLTEIATHKAGIIKENCPVFVYPNKVQVMVTIESIAQEKNSPIFKLDPRDISNVGISPEGTTFAYQGQDFHLRMIGSQQAVNASLAVLALTELRRRHILTFSDQALLKGLAQTKLMVRMEVLQQQPFLLLDGAHNVQGARALAHNLKYFNYEKLIMGIGMFQDKDVQEVLKILVPCADEIIVSELPMPRKKPAEQLAREIESILASRNDADSKVSPALQVEIDTEKALALSLSKAGPKDLILWCGSLYLAGEIRKRFFQKH